MLENTETTEQVEQTEEVVAKQTAQEVVSEIKEHIATLKNNNANGNEIIAIKDAEISELTDGLIEIRDDLLEMITRVPVDKVDEDVIS